MKRRPVAGVPNRSIDMSTQQTYADRELPRTNILAVTGLSRRSLAAMFRRDGLYGHDSALSTIEQAVVQSRLPAIEGLATPATPSILDGRLKRLADYVEALQAGRDAGIERQRLQAEGYAPAAIREAAVTVDNVRVVFGPVAAVAATQPGKTGERSQMQYARAA